MLYKLTGDAYVDLRYDYRHYNARYVSYYVTGDAILQMDSSRVSLGVAFSLGETSSAAW